jgi:hypothetical protein
MNGLENFFAYMAANWHWLIALIICSLVSGAIRDAFGRWSKHRIALAKARQPAAPPQFLQLLPPPGKAAEPPGPAKLVECQHYAPNVTAVLDQVSGERLAWYCQACDSQLPPNWALATDEGK